MKSIVANWLRDECDLRMFGRSTQSLGSIRRMFMMCLKECSGPVQAQMPTQTQRQTHARTPLLPKEGCRFGGVVLFSSGIRIIVEQRRQNHPVGSRCHPSCGGRGVGVGAGPRSLAKFTSNNFTKRSPKNRISDIASELSVADGLSFSVTSGQKNWRASSISGELKLHKPPLQKRVLTSHLYSLATNCAVEMTRNSTSCRWP